MTLQRKHKGPSIVGRARSRLKWLIGWALFWYAALWACSLILGLAWPLITTAGKVGAAAGAFVLVAFLTRRTRPGALIWWGLVDALGFVMSPFHGRTRQAEADPWDALEPRFVRAFIEAGLLKAPKDDEPPLHIRRAGPTVNDGQDVTYRIHLPAGVTFSAVAGKRESFAQTLGLPKKLLTLHQGELDPAGVVTVTVSRPYVRETREWSRPAVVGWEHPAVIGRDRKGGQVTIPTVGTGALLFGGQTNSGKTSAMWLLAAHYALDPEARLFVVDGKSARPDWGPLERRAERTLYKSDPNSGARFVALVQDVLGIVETRNVAGFGDSDHCTEPGVLLILEEFANFLGGLEPKVRKAAEQAVGELVSTARSVNVMVLIAAQEPSADMMPTFFRKQAAVSIALSLKADVSYGMVLGDGFDTSIPKPKAKGQARVAVAGEPDRFVELDYMPKAAWKQLCASLPSSQPVWVPADATVPVTPPAATQPVRKTRPAYVPTGRAGVGVNVDQGPAVAPVEGLHLVPDPAPAAPVATPLEDALFEALTNLGGNARKGQLVTAVEGTGVSVSTIERTLRAMVKSGDLTSPTKGRYALTTADDTSSSTG